MKKKELKDTREKSIGEIKKLISEKGKELVLLRGEISVGKHKNIRVAKQARRQLSQLITILGEKGLPAGPLRRIEASR